jgi:hypothetical protein
VCAREREREREEREREERERRESGVRVERAERREREREEQRVQQQVAGSQHESTTRSKAIGSLYVLQRQCMRGPSKVAARV